MLRQPLVFMLVFVLCSDAKQMEELNLLQVSMKKQSPKIRCPFGYSWARGVGQSLPNCPNSILEGQCVMSVENGYKFCDSNPLCTMVSYTSNKQWQGIYGKSSVQLSAGSGRNRNYRDWSSCMKMPKRELRVLVIGASEMGPCQNATLKAMVMPRGPTMYRWTVDFGSGFVATDAQQRSLQNLSEQLTLQSGKNVNFGPDPELMNVQMTVNVEASNKLGSGKAAFNMMWVNKALPRLKMPPRISTTQGQTLVVRARASTSSCVSGGQLTYEWEVSPSVDLSKVPTKNSQLLIRPGTLKSGKTYSAKVCVSPLSDPSLSVCQSTEIKVSSQPLMVTVRGPSTVGSGKQLNFKAIVTDPDESTDGVLYWWTLHNVDGSLYYVDGSLLGKLSSGSGGGETVTVDSKSLKLRPGFNYVVSVRVQKGARRAEHDQQFKVVDGTPPTIVIFGDMTFVNPSDKVRIRARVAMPPGGGNYSWGWNGTSPLTSLTQLKGVVGEEPKDVALVMPSMTLDYGMSYTFKLTACTSAGLCSHSEVYIITGTPPSIENLSLVNPSDEVRIQASVVMPPGGGEYTWNFWGWNGTFPLPSLMLEKGVVGEGQKDLWLVEPRLTLAGGMRYTFELTACNSEGLCSHSEVDIIANHTYRPTLPPDLTVNEARQIVKDLASDTEADTEIIRRVAQSHVSAPQEALGRGDMGSHDLGSHELSESDRQEEIKDFSSLTRGSTRSDFDPASLNNILGTLRAILQDDLR